MDLKRLISQVSYRIEPNPVGGFIARSTDPAVPPIEAPTREELVQKIQQKALDFLSSEFPGLKLLSGAQTREISFHVEHKPDGGFSIHSADSNGSVIHAADEHELQSQFLEKVLNFSAKHLTPEMSKALAAQVGLANFKVVLNGKTALGVNSGTQGTTFGASTGSSFQTGSAAIPKLDAPVDFAGTLDGKPITPESSNALKKFAFLLLILLLGAAMYFIVHR